jgi:hypothetical protein
VLTTCYNNPEPDLQIFIDKIIERSSEPKKREGQIFTIGFEHIQQNGVEPGVFVGISQDQKSKELYIGCAA